MSRLFIQNMSARCHPPHPLPASYKVFYFLSSVFFTSNLLFQ